jgi:UDP-N-acetylglucosamine--N-acetylmuramyl-(pentapeptide) pyrophosphoryl-undecaprenol N-acetylglucosamine transferase
MRVVIAGGGTGGHLYPGIALAHEFMRVRPGSSVLFVGTERGLEARVVPREGFELATIRVRGLVGRGALGAVATLAMLPAALFEAWGVLRRFRPDLVVGVGGYAAGPTIVAARLMRRAIVLLEQNVLPGVTNRWLSPIADLVAASFEESRAAFSGRVEVLGNPVRPAVVAAGRTALPDAASILVFGGSQGAKAINRAVTGSLAALSKIPGLAIVHQTGHADHADTARAYRDAGVAATVAPYLDDMGTAYAGAALVVARAGATTVAELTACGRPAILIPYPHAAHGHQERNARALESAGAAVVILERDLTGAMLGDVIAGLLADRPRLMRMAAASRALGRPDAGERIARACLTLAERG